MVSLKDHRARRTQHRRARPRSPGDHGAAPAHEWSAAPRHGTAMATGAHAPRARRAPTARRPALIPGWLRWKSEGAHRSIVKPTPPLDSLLGGTGHSVALASYNVPTPRRISRRNHHRSAPCLPVSSRPPYNPLQ